MFILSFTMIVVMLGFGMVIPIFPFYVDQFGAGGIELGLLMAVYALMRMIFAPIWGRLSDRRGRKPSLMLGVFGYGITMVMFGLATNLWLLFGARLLSGILSSATSPTTMAYVSDSTTEDQRGRGMGMLGAAMGLGMILGPGIGGWLGGGSLSRPFFISGALCLVALALIYFFLPESLAQPDRSGDRGPIPRFQSFKVLAQENRSISVILFTAFLVNIGMTIFYGIFGLYALDKYNYGTDQVGAILTVIGIAAAVAQGGLVGPLTRRWGETKVILGGLLGCSLGFLLMTKAKGSVSILLSIAFFILSISLLTPAITASISRYAPNDQGAVMGLINSFMSAGRIAGPLWGGLTYDLNIEYPYFSGSALFLVTFLGGFIWVRQVETRKFIFNRLGEQHDS
jgi:MFS transporter, DHA1 family, multidrug resistance protein